MRKNHSPPPDVADDVIGSVGVDDVVGFGPERAGPERLPDQKGQLVDHGETSGDEQNDEPEPHEDVDLLVEDVDGEDAEAVVDLDRTGASVLVEHALGHFGEDQVHRVAPVFRVHLRDGRHHGAVLGEHAAQEPVHQVQLEAQVDQRQKLAHGVLQEVALVLVNTAHLKEGRQVFLDSSDASYLNQWGGSDLIEF